MHDANLPPAEYLSAITAVGRWQVTRHAGRSVVWHVWGSGPALLLLHGNHGSWRHWARNVLDLARSFTVLAPDMPGCGESEPPPDPVSLTAIVAALYGGLDAVIGSDDPFALVGFSFGANMAGDVARLAGARASRLVLVGPAGLGLPQGPREALLRWRHLGERVARHAAHRRNLEILMIHDPMAVDELAIEIQAYGAESHRLRERPQMAQSPLRDALPFIEARIDAIWGASDNAAGLTLASRREALSTLRPEAGQFIIEGAGHWVQYEAADRFNGLMHRILA
jgi:pimeloyl-ACP methyl ester carboxylesterase